MRILTRTKSLFWLKLFLLITVYLICLAIALGALGLGILHLDFVIHIDQQFALFMQSLWRPDAIKAMTIITNIGGSKSVALLVVSMLVFMLINRIWPMFFGLIISVIGDVLTVSIIKHLVARPRPTAMYYFESSYSFPSGHSGASVALYGFLGYILFRLFKMPAIWAVLFAMAMAFSIGFSRLYLVEHYLSDVLNGWIIGTFWLSLGIIISEWLLSKSNNHPNYQRATLCIPIVLAVFVVCYASIHIPTRHDMTDYHVNIKTKQNQT